MKLFKRIIFSLALCFVAIGLAACGKETTTKEVEYNINWIVEGVTVETDKVKPGEVPSFDGETPVKVESDSYTYTFSGWTPEVSAVQNDQDYTALFSETAKIKRIPSDVGLDSLKVTYDGLEHSLSIKNLPEGATVSYENNGRTEPGTQTVKANVLYYGVTYPYSAIINITKCESKFEISSKQTVESGMIPKFTVNNEEQALSYKVIYQPGTYTISVFMNESDHYYKSESKNIEVTVVEAKPLGIVFSSTKVVADGTEKELLATNIPEGYTVTYSNNKSTKAQRLYATCNVFDAESNKVAEIRAIFEVVNQENKEFTKFLDDFLVEYLGDDYFAWNIYFTDPEKAGFVRTEYGDPEWYSYVKFDEAFRSEALQDFVDIYDELITYEKQDLSPEQITAYQEVLDFTNFYLDYYAVQGDWQYQLENLSYVDQFGGYCSDFASSMEGYTFRDEEDVKDILSYIKSTSVSYPTYVTYAKDRITAGYPLSDYTLNEMIDYLDDIKEEGENYYLIVYIQKKIDNLNFLTDEQNTSYNASVKDYFVNYFLKANESLATGLKECLGHITKVDDEGYLAKYTNGSTIFLEDLRDLIGNPELQLEDYNKYLDQMIGSYQKKIDEIIKSYRLMSPTQGQEWYRYISGASIVGITDPNEMVVYLKEFAKSIVPDLGVDINVVVKYMDETEAKKSNAVAYYMRSAIDSVTDEYITLNGLKTKNDSNDTLSTMAHEGYPGHLYAHVFVKSTSYPNILKVMSSTAFSEGWATYVQLKLYDYMKETITSGSSTAKKTRDLAIDYLYYNQLIGYLLYCKVDEMIHCEHKTIAEIATYMDDLGFNGGAAEEIYRTLIEMPTGYAAYGYGQIFMNDLHISCETTLGNLYNEVDYNKFILSTTQDSLFDLQALTDGYIADMNFLYGSN